LHLILSIVISLFIYIFRNIKFTKILSIIFLISQITISIFSFSNIGKVDSLYFKFDAFGVILSLVLSILSLATFYHSSLYLKRHNFSQKQESIYYSALIMLIAAMMSAYFAENIAVLWFSIETTTLLVSILIFHEPEDQNYLKLHLQHVILLVGFQLD
jgi:formate hydrogenlyase subunit 3/multisubunit Na+/H+ antiporter MnhD subunit